MKILVVEDIKAEEGRKFLSSHEKLIKQVSPYADIIVSDQKSYTKYIKNADVIIPSIHIDYKKAGRLKWVHLTSAGVNYLPPELINSKILLTNSSGVHPIPIAEQIFSYLLIFARQMDKALLAQKQKKWLAQIDFSVFELHNKTIGIVGLGRIGEQTALIAKAFGMKVIALARTPKKTIKNVDQMLTTKDLSKLLKDSDFVVNCLPGTSLTRHMFTIKEFKKMKPAAFFINIGRGLSVNEKDLVKALKEKIIAGAGLDVFEVEPLPKASPLWNMENVILTPHHAGMTPYYMDRVIEIFCENLKAYLKNQPMPTLVDKKLGY